MFGHVLLLLSLGCRSFFFFFLGITSVNVIVHSGSRFIFLSKFSFKQLGSRYKITVIAVSKCLSRRADTILLLVCHIRMLFSPLKLAFVRIFFSCFVLFPHPSLSLLFLCAKAL